MEELSSDANQIHCDIRLQVRMRSIRDAFLFYNLNTTRSWAHTFEINCRELQTVLNQLLNTGWQSYRVWTTTLILKD